MSLAWFVLLPLLGGLVAWCLPRRGARFVALATLAVGLVASGRLMLSNGEPQLSGFSQQFQAPWIPMLGVSFHLAVDGLGAIMLVLAFGVGLLAILGTWNDAVRRAGLFYLNLLWVVAGAVGVFLAMDLLLFYVLWEVMLVPMCFLIGIWGHGERVAAAVKFFIFTQVASLLMLAAIVALALLHLTQYGTLSFSYFDLLEVALRPQVANWLFWGFFIGFAVKLPVIPLHSWLPDAHTEAPTAGSVILAGLLLKTGGYGLLRFVVPLFPDSSAHFAPLVMGLGALGVMYGGLLAYAQSDLKRLVAYSSISHLGFVLLGVFALNESGHHGAVLQMVCHALSTGGLFILVGQLQQRLRTRDLNQMGGLKQLLPRMGTVATFLAMASLGLPGLGNFVAEFLVLFAAFQVNPGWAAVAAAGLVVATIYSLRVVQGAFHGQHSAGFDNRPLADLNQREVAVFAGIVAALLALGLRPALITDVLGETPMLALRGEQ